MQDGKWPMIHFLKHSSVHWSLEDPQLKICGPRNRKHSRIKISTKYSAIREIIFFFWKLYSGGSPRCERDHIVLAWTFLNAHINSKNYFSTHWGYDNDHHFIKCCSPIHVTMAYRFLLTFRIMLYLQCPESTSKAVNASRHFYIDITSLQWHTPWMTQMPESTNLHLGRTTICFDS